MSAHKKVTRQSVHYRPGTPAKRCGDCVMYTQNPDNDAIGTCDILTGPVDKGYVCDRFERKTK